MHQIILFITNLENDKDKNVKMHHKLMAATIWQFSLKIAEKFFIYGDNACYFAKDMLFMALHSNMDSVLKHIHFEHIARNLDYDDNHIYNIFLDAYAVASDNLNKKQNLDFYT